MGSIVRFNNNPKSWPIINEKKLKPEYGGETIYEIEFGTTDYDGEEWINCTYIRKSLYDAIMDGHYRVEPTGDKCAFNIIDNDGNIVPKISPQYH